MLLSQFKKKQKQSNTTRNRIIAGIGASIGTGIVIAKRKSIGTYLRKIKGRLVPVKAHNRKVTQTTRLKPSKPGGDLKIGTRGVAQDDGYQALSNTDNLDNFVLKNGTDVHKLIDVDGKPSIILHRDRGKLKLAITSLTPAYTKNTKDYQGRLTRVYFNMAVDAPDENKLKSIAAYALRDMGGFTNLVEKHIKRGGSYTATKPSWEVDFEKLSQELATLTKPPKTKTVPPSFLDKDIPETRSRLADQLENNPLPDTDNILLLTTIKTKKTLKDAGFYYSLSSRWD